MHCKVDNSIYCDSISRFEVNKNKKIKIGNFEDELYGHEIPVREPQDIKYNVSGSSPFMAHFKGVGIEKNEKNVWLLTFFLIIIIILISITSKS